MLFRSKEMKRNGDEKDRCSKATYGVRPRQESSCMKCGEMTVKDLPRGCPDFCLTSITATISNALHSREEKL